jgi:hypothetical protein
LPESVKQRRSNRLLAVADFVKAARALARDAIGELALLELGYIRQAVGRVVGG